MGVDLMHLDGKSEADRDFILDKVLSEDDLFTEMAVSYAREATDMVPELSFFEYSINTYIRQHTPEYKNAWRDENV